MTSITNSLKALDISSSTAQVAVDLLQAHQIVDMQFIEKT